MDPMVEEWLPEHDTFNNTYFCEVIIPRLTNAVFPDQGRQCKQPVSVRMHNANLTIQKDQSNESTTIISKGCPIHHIRQILSRMTFIF
jgi:hypothetical protein